MKVSFILGTRNDGYGGSCPGLGDYTMRRLELTCESIARLGLDSETIVVEWCPEEHSIPQSINAAVVTVPSEANDILNDDGQNKISYYEYVAKKIGVLRSSGDILCLCNPDNIFPSNGMAEAIEMATRGHVALAVRKDIHREYCLTSCETILQLINDGKVDVFRKFETAGGDFTMISRDNYMSLGGYPLCHGAWDVDNWFIRHANACGVPSARVYTHFHIDHDHSTTEVAGRPKGSVDTYKPISREAWNKVRELACA